MCAAFEAEYESATDARDEELDLLVEVRAIVARHLDEAKGSSVNVDY